MIMITRNPEHNANNNSNDKDTRANDNDNNCKESCHDTGTAELRSDVRANGAPLQGKPLE